jgi:hypothetical protein
VFILSVKNTQPTGLYDVHKSQLASSRKFNSVPLGKTDFLKIKSGTNTNSGKQNIPRVFCDLVLLWRLVCLVLRRRDRLQAAQLKNHCSIPGR